ncbi:hypothetical protein AB0E69_05875 [Kribbella sp. NPDC026611]|uniref:hypothetical protein n=1 Tax=Kribbella sp. NPDC026611 TaxID=3154911 RepID=UPI00340FD49A
MSRKVDLLTEELEQLHRGRGVHAPAVEAKLGPHLRELIFGDNEPDESEARSLIRASLVSAAEVLPADLAQVFRTGLGVDDTTPLLGDRLERLGRLMDRGARTMSRRLHESNRAVAQVLERRSRISDDRNPFATKGWYVDRLESHAEIDERPTFLGIRDIKFTHANVRYLCESFTVPQGPGLASGDEVTVEPTEGCDLVEVNRFSPSCWQLTLHLPRAFNALEKHRVGLKVTMPSRDFIRPYNIVIAVRRTRSFHASVTFGPDIDVDKVWRYDGVPPPTVDDGAPAGGLLEPTPGRTVRADWPIVRQGLAYGLGWS